MSAIRKPIEQHPGHLDTVDYEKPNPEQSVNRPAILQLPDLNSHAAATIPDVPEDEPDAEPLIESRVDSHAETLAEATDAGATAVDPVAERPAAAAAEEAPHAADHWLVLYLAWLKNKLTLRSVILAACGVVAIFALGTVLFPPDDEFDEDAARLESLQAEQSDSESKAADSKPTVVLAMPGQTRKTAATTGSEPAPSPDEWMQRVARAEPPEDLPQEGNLWPEQPPRGSQSPRQPGVARFKGFIESVTPTAEARYEPYRPGLH